MGDLLDVQPPTLRGWIKRIEVDGGQRPGIPTANRPPTA